MDDTGLRGWSQSFTDIVARYRNPKNETEGADLPFVADQFSSSYMTWLKNRFLKTIIPSRKATRRYSLRRSVDFPFLDVLMNVFKSRY